MAKYMEPTLYVAAKKGKKPEHKVREDMRIDSKELGTVKGGETVLVTGEAHAVGKDGAKVPRLRVAVPLSGWVNGEKFSAKDKAKDKKDKARQSKGKGKKGRARK